jgi:hypothetical protein
MKTYGEWMYTNQNIGLHGLTCQRDDRSAEMIPNKIEGRGFQTKPIVKPDLISLTQQFDTGRLNIIKHDRPFDILPFFRLFQHGEDRRSIVRLSRSSLRSVKRIN